MQPTVPASLLLGVHPRQPTAFLFLLSSWGVPLSRPQSFCPVPSLASWPSSQSSLACESSPRRFSCLFGLVSEGQAEPLPSAKNWVAPTVEEAMSTWQKNAGQCDTRNLQHPSGDLSSNNALKVLSHLHAMLQTSRNVFRPVVRPGDPAFHLLTRRTRSPDFLP